LILWLKEPWLKKDWTRISKSGPNTNGLSTERLGQLIGTLAEDELLQIVEGLNEIIS
jgi:hypothetical protein